jgi:23S rRNA pseudouridine1911/1915/1917 synthase
VRPVAWAAAAVPAPDRGKPYRTEITGVELLPPGTLGSAGGSPGNFTGDGAEGYRRFYVRISRGFRHQIRCHLSWIGYPILNDGLYGEGKTGGGAAGKAEGSFLALTAVGLSFPDPRTGEKRDFFLS